MSARSSRQAGLSLVEVLVTLVVLAIGLLGVMGLQARLQQSEVEAYQRSQALLLLEDMAARLAANRTAAASYATGSGPLGVGMDCPADSGSRQQRDAAQWCAALQGAAESSAGSRVGAMLGGRGCVENLGGGQYLVSVAWQGLGPLSAPPASQACARNLYDGTAGSGCVNDRCRRVVSTLVRIAPL